MQSSKILLKDGQIVDLVDGRINDGDIDTWNNKLNVEITSNDNTVQVSETTNVQTNTKTFDISVNTDIVATNKDVSDLESNMNYKLDSKEDVSNKIQVVNDSSTTEYPSSKAVANFVNSSVSTNTATFLGNFSLEDLGLTYPATEVQIASALNSHTWPTGYPTNNDYVYVEISNPQSSIYDKVQRYKYRGSVASWGYEYTLNNSSFTSEEMAAIDSGITSQDVTNLRVDHTTLESHVHATSNPHSVTKAQVGLSKVDNTSDADKPVSTAQQNALNKKLDKTGNASNTTATFTKNSGDTSSMTSSKNLSTIFTAISSFFASLKALAFKDKVSDSDINGTISNSHIASASTWNGKYTKPSTGIPKTDLASGVQASLGKADSALQSHQSVIDNKPTLSWGAQSTVGTVGGTALHVTMPSPSSDVFYVDYGITSFETILSEFATGSGKKLILRVGKPGSGAYSTSYYLPLYRVQFNGNTITEFVWMLDSDAYGDASGSNTYGAIYLYKLNDSGWSNSSDNVHYALAAGTAYGGTADHLKFSGNEINFKNVPTSGNKQNLWFNFRNGDTGEADSHNKLTDYYFADRNMRTNTTLHADRLAGTADSADSAKSVNATVGNSITSTGTNGSMEILNGALSSSSGGGGSCSIDGDGISFTKGVVGSSMTADGISTAGTGTFTGGVEAKGRTIDGSAKFVANSRLTWASSTTNLVVNRAAGSTTTIDLKNLLNDVVYWLHVPRDNIIALWNSSAISTFYCYDESFTVNRTTDTYDIRSHIRGGSHGGFSTAIVRSNNNFYVMMDY